MDLPFAIKIITVTASGALAPGPLTAASVALGARDGAKAGLKLAIGHTLAEFPLVLAIAYGLSSLVASPSVRIALGLVGAFFTIFFAILTLKEAFKGSQVSNHKGKGKPLIVGASLSIFNPFFIMWWLGVGSPLVIEAVEDGFSGLIAFYLVHVWVDYAWLTATAQMGSLAKFKTVSYRAVLACLGTILFYFGADMLVKALAWISKPF